MGSHGFAKFTIQRGREPALSATPARAKRPRTAYFSRTFSTWPIFFWTFGISHMTITGLTRTWSKQWVRLRSDGPKMTFLILG